MMDDEKRTEESFDIEKEDKPEEEERRGLFGAKKRKRDDKTVLTLYLLAAFYLLYTAYSMIKDLTYEGLVTGKMRIFNIVFSIVFAGVAIWVLFSCFKVYKKMREKEKEKAEKEAAEAGDGAEPAPKTGLFNLMRQEEQKPSIASRAAVYYNPADDDDDDDDGDGDENKENENEEKEEKDGSTE